MTSYAEKKDMFEDVILMLKNLKDELNVNDADDAKAKEEIEDLTLHLQVIYKYWQSQGQPLINNLPYTNIKLTT